MTTYEINIGCGNCFARRKYVIERGIATTDADLICPNCGCCPTEEDFGVITKEKKIGKSIIVKEE